MKKSVYIFNCTGAIDLLLCLKLYTDITKLIDLFCNQYCCMFTDKNGKIWSRSGVVKNIEQNFLKYSKANGDTLKLTKLEIYNQPKDIESWGLENSHCGFYVYQSDTDSFHIYLVLSNNLLESQIVDIWYLLRNSYTTRYMVSFSLDAHKNAEIYMYGRPIYPVNADEETYYSPLEKAIVYKLHALHLQRTCNLESVFPLCIVTEDIDVERQSYSIQRTIGEGVLLLKK